MSNAVEHAAADVEALDDNYTKQQLLDAALSFGVEVKTNMSKSNVISAFLDDGVTHELIRGIASDDDEDSPEEPNNAVEAAPVEEEEEDLVLVKMLRANGTYEIRGYTFKAAHPYALVKETDADFLIENDGGFAMASPREAKEFYS